MDDAERRAVDLPSAQLHEAPLPETTIAGGTIFMHNLVSWRSKIDADESVPRGIFTIDPERGSSRHLQPDTAFAGIEVVEGGEAIIGLDTGANTVSPRLLRIDPASGELVAQRTLDRGTWSLSHTLVPEALIPTSPVDVAVDTRDDQ